MKADEREIRPKPLLVNGGQGRTDARSELGQRSCPKAEDRPKPIRINRTTDTRIFSEQISQSSMTQDKPRARKASDLRLGRCSWVTVGAPGLGIKAGTRFASSPQILMCLICFLRNEIPDLTWAERIAHIA